MTPGQFAAMRYPFPAFNSFAIWDLNNLENLGVINVHNCGMLKTCAVILGEGGGGYVGAPQSYRNFHAVYKGSRDSWLCEAFFHDPGVTIPSRVFSGAFMTDVDKGTGTSLADFIAELGAIGFNTPAGADRIIIALGDTAARFLAMNVAQIGIQLGINNIVTRSVPHFQRRGIHHEEFVGSVRLLETETIAAGWQLH